MGSALCLCDWHDRPCAEHHLRRIIKQVHADFRVATSAVLELTKRQLDDYFAGRRTAFSIPLHPVGTDFQQRVWSALRSIPYGETRSYKHIAQSIGCQQGVRAVAQAMGANGLCILIPCHRVVGSNGSLTGFTGGLDKKAYLLQMEQCSGATQSGIYYCPLNPKTTPLTFRETEVWLSAYHGQAPFVKK